MLTQNYTYYLFKIVEAGLLTWVGILSLLLLVAAFVVPRLVGPGWLRPASAWGFVIAAVVTFVLAFNSATYTFDERPETLVIESLPPGEPDCGTARTGWIRSGYGIGNPCPAGCYRGKVVAKQMRMRGLPPWPQYRREMQCWTRD